MTGVRYYVQHPLNCHSTNIIYLITCKKCSLQYVGETKQTLKQRLLEHCGDTKHNRDKPVARHFNQADHSTDDITIMAIDRPANNNYFHRLTLEAKWIQLLQTTKPNGINIKRH